MIDDANSPTRRYPNSRFRDLSPDKYRYYPQTPELYARSTCFHNNILDVDESTRGFIAEGSGGVARKGSYVKNGVRMDGVIKLVLKEKMSYEDLKEVKVALEVQRVVPDYVIETNILERCDILNSGNMPDNVNASKDLLLIGMERGINSVAGEINQRLSVDHLQQLIKQSLKACYEFNCAGFFHRDIKPENMVVVERKGRQEAVLIDFGETVYMSHVEDYSTGIFRNYSTNPPFDAMYLGLFFLNDANNSNVRKYILNKLQRYYTILKHLEPRFDSINSRFFDHYRLSTPLATFQRLQKKLDLEITKKYLRKHTNRVNFYRNLFNNSIIRGFTYDEAGFQLLKNSSIQEDILQKKQQELQQRIMINKQKKKQQDILKQEEFLKKKQEEILQKKQQELLQEELLQQRIMINRQKIKQQQQEELGEENINFLKKKEAYLKRKRFLGKRSPIRSPKNSPSWRNYRSASPVKISSGEIPSGEFREKSPSPVKKFKKEKVYPVFRKSPLDLKSPKKPKTKKRYLTPNNSISPPPFKRLRIHD
jgi:serine/threonine protein kinase